MLQSIIFFKSFPYFLHPLLPREPFTPQTQKTPQTTPIGDKLIYKLKTGKQIRNNIVLKPESYLITDTF